MHPHSWLSQPSYTLVRIAIWPDIETFLELVYQTEAPLMYAPSQLAISAIIMLVRIARWTDIETCLE